MANSELEQSHTEAVLALSQAVMVVAKKAKNDPDPAGSVVWADIAVKLAKSHALISGKISQTGG